MKHIEQDEKKQAKLQKFACIRLESHVFCYGSSTMTILEPKALTHITTIGTGSQGKGKYLTSHRSLKDGSSLDASKEGNSVDELRRVLTSKGRAKLSPRPEIPSLDLERATDRPTDIGQRLRYETTGSTLGTTHTKIASRTATQTRRISV
jgi:hypothetical protein